MLKIICVTGILLGNISSCGADQDFDLYVIIHGLQLNKSLPSWTTDLALAINSQNNTPQTGNRVKQSVVQMDRPDPQINDRFIIYDWSFESREIGNAWDATVVAPLCNAIKTRAEKHHQSNNRPVNIHFISHSRGCYVANAVITQMRIEDLLGLVQWTSLDPYSIKDTALSPNLGDFASLQLNFFQKGKISAIKGRKIPSSINIDLTSILDDWKVSANNHSSIHYWYHWRYLNGTENLAYDDPVNIEIAKTFTGPNGPNLRKKLFGTSVIVENFNDNEELPFTLQGEATVNDGELTLAEPKEFVQGRIFTKETVTLPCLVSFTFRMDNPGGRGDEFWAADGITCVELGADKNLAGDSFGGFTIGARGLNGRAVAFDTFFNKEYGDEPSPKDHVSLRYGGQSKYIRIPRSNLPEPSNSGNKFFANIKFFEDEIRMRIYSPTKNKYVDISQRTPTKYRTKGNVRYGLTAATGWGWQNHVIDNVLITPFE